jgi:peptide/nickel transport system permease protein
MSLLHTRFKEFNKNKLAMLSLVTILILICIGLFADFLAPYDPDAINLVHTFEAPSASHLMGTDQLGRDLLSRVIYGTQVTFQISFITAIIAVIIGVAIGILAGYYGGIIDEILMRLTDTLLAFPDILFVLIIVGGMGAGVTNTVFAIVITGWLTYARVTRASTLSLKEKEFIEGARAMGFSDTYICTRYIFPNCLSPIIVLLTMNIGSIILTVASLGYLGLGAQPPVSEWGSMLNSGQEVIRDCPWLSVFPGLMIVITVLAFNFMGDGLRDMLDPRQVVIK